MKKRFTEEQIIGFLREAEADLPVAELCRQTILKSIRVRSYIRAFSARTLVQQAQRHNSWHVRIQLGTATQGGRLF